jgi:hypothetical protein
MVPSELVFSQYDIAKEKFPKLTQPELVGEHWEIKGSIDVIDDEGFIWDNFDVKIIIPKTLPEELFQLHETGKRIPREAYWHNSITCCLSTNATIYFILAEDVTLLNWLNRFAHPFLANYVYKRKTGHYANGEFEHETKGIIEGYEKLFGLSGVSEVSAKLETLCSLLKLERNDLCFCGSQIKFKKCYQKLPFSHKYSNIPFPQLVKDLEEIRVLRSKIK